MRGYIANVLPRLKKYSARLDNLALFTDHPWIQSDDSGDRTVFVFRSEGNELLISKNGNVKTCSWEYLDYMNSLLVEVGGQKKLYNQGFIDEDVMILSKDGKNNYLLLANENKVGERDGEKIITTLTRKYLTPRGATGSTQSGGDTAVQKDSSQQARQVRRHYSQSKEQRVKEEKILKSVAVGLVILVVGMVLIVILMG